MKTGVRLLSIIAISISPSVAEAEDVVAGGLTNTPIGLAEITPGYSGPSVSGIKPFGTDGISIHVGHAESGFSILPNTWEYMQNGMFMVGRAYGRTGGTNDQLLSTVRGYRLNEQWRGDVTFASSESTNVNYRIWLDGAQVVDAVGQAGEITVNSSYGPAPRVSPIWRMPNGDVGALVEFDYPVSFHLPIGSAIAGERLLIRPFTTNMFEFVSRMDVFAGGAMSTFVLDQLGVGVFGRAHHAFGDVLLEPGAGRIRAKSLPSTGWDRSGLGVRLQRALHASANLEPVALTNDGSLFEVSPAFGYFGTLRVQHTNGSLRLVSDFFFDFESAAAVYSSNALVGTATVAGTNVSGTLSGTPRITRVGASATTPSEEARIWMEFDRPTTFTADGGPALTGDRIEVFTPEVRAEWFSLLYISGNGIEEFTITGESETGAPPLRLDIARDGTNVVLTWADPVGIYNLQGSMSAEGFGFMTLTNVMSMPSNGLYRVSVPASASMQFFRLGRFIIGGPGD
jgi:hypothetical protein